MLSRHFCQVLLLLVTARLLASCDSATEPSDNGTEPVASLTVSPTQLDLLLRDVMQLAFEAKDSAGNVLADRVAAFSSSDTEIATVSGDGLVTAVAEGAATITVTVEGLEASASVTVSVLDFTSISTSSWHTCALTTDGSAYCWGNNQSGQLGLGTLHGCGDHPDFGAGTELFSCSTRPVPVSGGHVFEMVSAAGYHTCGLTGDGEAYCWGSNEHGQLGDGTTIDRHTPVRVEAATHFMMVDAGGSHTCAVSVDGDAFCWGYNSWYELGDGTNVQRNTPVAVSGALQFEWVSAGSGSTCGIITGGAAYCWGANNYGELGNGSTGIIVPTPGVVSGGLAFQWIGTGSYSTCGLTLAGDAYCWGRNHVGQLGDGTTTQRTEPVVVSGGLTYEYFSVGTWHTCGATTQGMLYCWGNNEEGELGDGTSADKSVPALVSDELVMQTVAGGSQHTCAVTTTGSAYCWGYSAHGQLGHGSSSLDALNPGLVIGSR